jgi:hypothetical protein
MATAPAAAEAEGMENATLPNQGFASRPGRERFQGPHAEGNLYAVVHHFSLYGSTYVNDVVDDLLRGRSHHRWVPVRDADEIPDGQRPSLLWQEYEEIDWDCAFAGVAGAGGTSRRP